MAVINIRNEADIPSGGVGVYVKSQGQAGAIRAGTGATVGIIGAFQYGPVNTWYEPENNTDLMDRHFPFHLATGLDAFLEISNVPFNKIKVYNTYASGSAVKATRTFVDDDGTPENSMIITAREYGSQGNAITITITANGSVATSRDVRVYVTAPDGTLQHDETYLAVQVSNGTVTDPGDPYVVMATAPSANEPAVPIAGAALSGGTNGTMTAALHLAGIDAGLGEDEAIDIFVVVGAATGIKADIKAGMLTRADANPGKVFILPATVATSRTSAITDVATYRGDYSNIRATWPYVERSIFYNHNGYAVSGSPEVDGGAMLAMLIQRTPAWKPAMKAQVKDLTSSIIGLEVGYTDTTQTGYAALSAAGIMAWERNRALNNRYVPYNDVTTTQVSSVATHGETARYAWYLRDAIAQFLDRQIGVLALDIDLPGRKLGPDSSSVIGSIEQFLGIEERQLRIVPGFNTDGTASPAFVVDPFVNATAPDLAAGVWGIYVAARKTPYARQIVLSVLFGTQVDIQIREL